MALQNLQSFVDRIAAFAAVETEKVSRNRTSNICKLILSFLLSAPGFTLLTTTLAERIGSARMEEDKEAKPVKASALKAYATHVSGVVDGKYCPIPKLTPGALQMMKVLPPNTGLVEYGNSLALETFTPAFWENSLGFLYYAKVNGKAKFGRIELTCKLGPDAKPEEQEQRNKLVDDLLQAYDRGATSAKEAEAEAWERNTYFDLTPEEAFDDYHASNKPEVCNACAKPKS